MANSRGNGWHKIVGSNQFNTMELLINHISKHHKNGIHPMLPVSLGISAETAFIKPHKETQLRD